MIIPTSGYSYETRNLGGMGLVKFLKSSSTGLYRLSVRLVTGSGGSKSYLGIGGFSIGVDVFSGVKVVHIYQPSTVTNAVMSNVWEGVPVEYSQGTGGNLLIMDSSLSDVSSPAYSGKELLIGGSQIAKDVNEFVYVKDMGSAEEEADAIIGNTMIRVGRFGDHWALGSVVV